MKHRDIYPSMIHDCIHGKGLFATCDIPPGTVVERFDGRIVKCDPNGKKPIPDGIPDEEINYFLIFDESTCIIPETNARYINHSCDPNCDIDDRREVVTIRPVKKGEELTFTYNEVNKEDTKNVWDPRWSFRCLCGSPSCQGNVDGYAYRENGKWIRIH
jgi:SET domain-containing protein